MQDNGGSHSTPTGSYSLSALYEKIKTVSKDVGRVEEEIKSIYVKLDKRVERSNCDKEIERIEKAVDEVKQISLSAKKQAGSHVCIRKEDINKMRDEIKVLTDNATRHWNAIDAQRSYIDKQSNNFRRSWWLMVTFIVVSAFILLGFGFSLNDKVGEVQVNQEKSKTELKAAKDKMDAVQKEQKKNGYIRKEDLEKALSNAVSELKNGTKN